LSTESSSLPSSETFDVHDPATGKKIGSAPEFNKDDTDKAIAAATEAFKTFRKTTARERAVMLRKWYDLMLENAEDLATLVCMENGKPIADARGEVAYAANFFLWFSEEVRLQSTPQTMLANLLRQIYRPLAYTVIPLPQLFRAIAS